MIATIRQRRDTAENWETANPIIPDGQIAYDTTNHTLRIGDGINPYLSLPILFQQMIDTKASIGLAIALS